MRRRDGRPTGTETRYETGFYQIISCHTDDDAAAELTPGLAFPVNAAANQTRPQSPPFSSFRPATLTRRVSLFVPLRVVFVVRLYPSLRVHPSLFRRGSHPRRTRRPFYSRPSPPPPSLSFIPLRDVPRATAVFPLLERSHGRKQKVLVGALLSQLAHLHARNL